MNEEHKNDPYWWNPNYPEPWFLTGWREVQAQGEAEREAKRQAEAAIKAEAEAARKRDDWDHLLNRKWQIDWFIDSAVPEDKNTSPEETNTVVDVDTIQLVVVEHKTDEQQVQKKKRKSLKSLAKCLRTSLRRRAMRQLQSLMPFSGYPVRLSR